MRRVRQLIDPALVARAGEMEALTRSLRELLPPALGSHCRVCGLESGTLLLSADGGGQATQLRYLQREIVKHMNAHHGLKLARVRIRVSVPAPGADRTGAGEALVERPPPHVPGSAAAALRTTARSIEDERLARALGRLADRAAGKAPGRTPRD